MSTQVSDNAWILHSRKYTDSRVIIDFLSESKGLISGVYRTPSKGQAPQMFRPLSIEWKGNHELKQVLSIEAVVGLEKGDETGSAYSSVHNYQGNALYCCLYLNELLIKSLLKEDPNVNIYTAYARALGLLRNSESLEPALREFEFTLLDELGYGLEFGVDSSGNPIEESSSVFYEFMLEEGFVSCAQNSSGTVLFDGQVLSNLARSDYSSADVRRAAKLLSRRCIDRLLGGRILRSRELFRTK